MPKRTIQYFSPDTLRLVWPLLRSDYIFLPSHAFHFFMESIVNQCQIEHYYEWNIFSIIKIRTFLVMDCLEGWPFFRGKHRISISSRLSILQSFINLLFRVYLIDISRGNVNLSFEKFHFEATYRRFKTRHWVISLYPANALCAY